MLAWEPRRPRYGPTDITRTDRRLCFQGSAGCSDTIGPYVSAALTTEWNDATPDSSEKSGILVNKTKSSAAVQELWFIYFVKQMFIKKTNHLVFHQSIFTIGGFIHWILTPFVCFFCLSDRKKPSIKSGNTDSTYIRNKSINLSWLPPPNSN